MREKIAIIGSGFSSLSASCYLSKAGFDVTILEKNNSALDSINVLKNNSTLDSIETNAGRK